MEFDRERQTRIVDQSEPSQLVPRHKGDYARARAAVQLGYPGVEPILGELLGWLQDYNWPVARILAPFLAAIGPVPPLVAKVREILAGTDLIWKHWVLSIVVDAWPDNALSELLPELQRMALTPTQEEVEEELPEVVIRLLERAGQAEI